MTTEERLRAVDWPQVMERMTLYAFKRCRGRSWELAQDVAQTAITQTFEPGGWDTEKEPIVERVIATRIRGLLANELKRSRNRFEIAMDEPDVESNVASATNDAADDRLNSLRYARAFHDRLKERLRDDHVAHKVVESMMDGLATPASIAKNLGADLATIRDSWRRVRYHAEKVAEEIDREMAALDETRESSK